MSGTVRYLVPHSSRAAMECCWMKGCNASQFQKFTNVMETERTPNLFVAVSMLSFWLSPCCEMVMAQNGGGDQILDGIGETALIARYELNGNVEDHSRNTYNAALHGAGTAFVDDARFGKVLSDCR